MMGVLVVAMKIGVDKMTKITFLRAINIVLQEEMTLVVLYQMKAGGAVFLVVMNMQFHKIIQPELADRMGISVGQMGRII
jgi:hypothetical protein